MAMKYKSSPVFEQDLTVDGNVIKGVVIVKEGKDKVGDYFTKDFLKNLAEQGNSYPQGIKSRFGHPNMCKDSLGTYLGRYKNFRVEPTESGDVVQADLHLDEVAAKSPEGNLLDYVKGMATKNPDMFGNSIVFSGTGEEKDIEGEMLVELSLQSFIASDLVDSPAATDGLFKSSDDLGVIMTSFLDENPSVMEAVAENPTLVADFFIKRYIPYLEKRKNNFNMSILDKVKSAFGITKKNIDLTLEGGDVVTVITDAESPAVGDKVEANGQPVADKVHILEDGTEIATQDSVITSINKPDETAPEETPVTEETQNQMAELQKGIDSLKSMIEGFEAKLAGIQKATTENEKAIIFIAKNVKSEYVPGVADAVSGDAPIEKAKRTVGNKFTKK